MNQSYITSIGTALPVNKISQKDILDYFTELMDLSAIQKRRFRAMIRFSAIENRYTVVNDILNPSKTFYQLEDSPSTKRRMELYKKNALEIATASINDCIDKSAIKLDEITDLVIVSCTGMYSPGLDCELIKHLGLNDSVNKTSIHFMGCCAAFNGLKVGDALCRKSENAKVLVVCVELCTLHLQYLNPEDTIEDNIKASLLFGDGAACVLLEGQPNGDRNNILLDGFFSKVVSETEEDIAWDIGDHGFNMKLSEYVPSLIESDIKAFIDSSVNERISDDTIYAIHPGGKKILEAVENALETGRLDYSREILKNYGNMSSATILFVLKEILEDEELKENQNIFACGFGPGITMEAASLTLNKKLCAQ